MEPTIERVTTIDKAGIQEDILLIRGVPRECQNCGGSITIFAEEEPPCWRCDDCKTSVEISLKE